MTPPAARDIMIRTLSHGGSLTHSAGLAPLRIAAWRRGGKE